MTENKDHPLILNQVIREKTAKI